MGAGRKDDEGKVRYDLVPPDFLRALASRLTLGAAKYGADNWRNVDDHRARYYSAAMRHLEAWRAGETADPDDIGDHLIAASACLAFLWCRDQVCQWEPAKRAIVAAMQDANKATRAADPEGLF